MDYFILLFFKHSTFAKSQILYKVLFDFCFQEWKLENSVSHWRLELWNRTVSIINIILLWECRTIHSKFYLLSLSLVSLRWSLQLKTVKHLSHLWSNFCVSMGLMGWTLTGNILVQEEAHLKTKPSSLLWFRYNYTYKLLGGSKRHWDHHTVFT